MVAKKSVSGPFQCIQTTSLSVTICHMSFEEPIMKVEVITPEEYMGSLAPHIQSIGRC